MPLDVRSSPLDSLVSRGRGILLGSAGFVPVWIVGGFLVAVAAILAPESLSATSLAQVWPFMSFLAVASLGQMLVVLTGGIDLSVPAVITMVSTVLIGVSAGSDERAARALLVALTLAALAGLVNGWLVAYVGLNPLVVTLATGQILFGLTAGYRMNIGNESAVPPMLANLAASRMLGMTTILWAGVATTVLVAVVMTRLAVGRHLQIVGANPPAAWIVGIDVRRYTVGGYAAAGVLYGVAGLLLASFVRTPTLEVGAPYLLGPIAVVVIAGASLNGGVASALSTWVAALVLTFLSTVLRVMGLPSSLQFVVFGTAIAAGMVISGDRIVGLVGRLSLRRPPASSPPTDASAETA